ncbi:MAG TPA: hypothetical protein VJ180_06355 [Pyrinomonadaceae bacterium]|nr:hypothetical protein [Pyrinomonadaceae bacterium]
MAIGILATSIVNAQWLNSWIVSRIVTGPITPGVNYAGNPQVITATIVDQS